MTEVLRDNVVVMKEFEKFVTDRVREPKDIWRKNISMSLYKTADEYWLRSLSRRIGMSE